MNHWLRRIAFISPPVIIAGAYFGYIPLGPGFKSRLDHFLGKKPPTSVTTSIRAQVEKVSGQVLLRESPGTGASVLKGGEWLRKGASLATGDRSSALLAFRGSSSWLVKIGPNSEINVDDLIETDGSLVLNLLRGGLLSTVKKTKLSVRTRFASYAVRGTTFFAVLTDGEKRSIMTVKDGKIEAENFRDMQKSLVTVAHSYLVNRNGEKKIELSLEAVNLFDWSPENLGTGFPSLDAVIEIIGDLGPAPDEKERAHMEFLSGIDQAIAGFKARNAELDRELSILSENAEQSREGLKQEIRKFGKDMRCLETSVSECALKSARLLSDRGFPRLWGPPKLRRSMILELKKYLQERDIEVKGREEEAKILRDLMKIRRRILTEVETQRKSEANLETLVPTLQDARLRR